MKSKTSKGATVQPRPIVHKGRMSLAQAAEWLGCTTKTVWRRINEGLLTKIVETIYGNQKRNYVPRTEVELLAEGRMDALREFHKQHYPDVQRPYLLMNGKKGK